MSLPKLKSRKKSQTLISLETLLGVVLSVIVLVGIVSYFSNAFQTSDNFDIAKSNADSIKDFVDLYVSPNSEYNGFDNCFGMLKLTNLQNFQIVDDRTLYFIVIDREKVSVVDYEDYGKFEKERSLENVRVRYDAKFSTDLILKEDKTEKGLSLSGEVEIVPFLFSVDFGKYGKLDITDDLKQPLIVIGPKALFDPSLFERTVFDGSNTLSVRIFHDETKINRKEDGKLLTEISLETESLDGRYLALGKNYNGVFDVLIGLNSDVSELFVKNNLCSKKELSNNFKINDYLEDISNLPYFTKKGVFKCDGVDDLELIWNKKFDCNTQVCEDFLDENDIILEEWSSIGADNKKSKFENYCILEGGKFSLEFEDLGLGEIDGLTKIEFNSIFEPLEKIKVPGERDEIPIALLTQEQKDKLVVLKDSNKNQCPSEKYGDLCNEFYLYKQRVYYYVKDSDPLAFYTTRRDVFREVQQVDGSSKLYFLDKEILKDDIDDSSSILLPDGFDNRRSSFDLCEGILECLLSITGSTDNSKIYGFRINGDLVEDSTLSSINVYLTPLQFQDITNLKSKTTSVNRFFSKFSSVDGEDIEELGVSSSISNCEGCGNIKVKDRKAYFRIRDDNDESFFSFDVSAISNRNYKRGDYVFFVNNQEVFAIEVTPKELYYIKLQDVIFKDSTTLESINVFLTYEQILQGMGLVYDEEDELAVEGRFRKQQFGESPDGTEKEYEIFFNGNKVETFGTEPKFVEGSFEIRENPGIFKFRYDVEEDSSEYYTNLLEISQDKSTSVVRMDITRDFVDRMEEVK